MKSRIKHVSITLEDGTVIEYHTGMYNQSRNYRTQGARITSEWYEHVVTWMTEVPKPEPALVEEVPTGINADELMKANPLFAGISDGRAFYHTLPPNWETLFKDFIAPGENGHV